MIAITPAAARQIQQAAEDSGAEDMALRVAAHYDQVADEVQYGMGFDEERAEDECHEVEGVSILISPLSREALANVTIDYVEISPGDHRFVFIPAQARGPNIDFSQPGGCSSSGCSSGGCQPKSGGCGR